MAAIGSVWQSGTWADDTWQGWGEAIEAESIFELRVSGFGSSSASAANPSSRQSAVRLSSTRPSVAGLTSRRPAVLDVELH